MKTLIHKDTCTPMSTETLFKIAKKWKQSKCPLTDEWIKKMRYIYTMEYFSAIKSERAPFTATLLHLKTIILSEVRQGKYYMTPFLCRL